MNLPCCARDSQGSATHSEASEDDLGSLVSKLRGREEDLHCIRTHPSARGGNLNTYVIKPQLPWMETGRWLREVCKVVEALRRLRIARRCTVLKRSMGCIF